MRHWLGIDKAEITAFAAERGQPAFRAGQFRDWLHNKRASDFNRMTNLPKQFRDDLAAAGTLRALREDRLRQTPDGLTAKWLFEAESEKDSKKDYFETVLIVEKRERRRTVCVSSMVGCPLACRFCATGKLGFTRNLNAGEMVEQVYRLDDWVRAGAGADGRGVSHVVFMGMGEPLLNLPAVTAAADIFTDPAGLGLSTRHVTISTAGVSEGIRRLAAEGARYRLALSLHAPNQELRERLLPVAAARWPLAELLPALEEYAALASRSVTFEYCLLAGVNDSPAQARELAAVVRPFGGRVNLIPWNGVAGSDFTPPAAKTVRAFQGELERRGVSAPVRMEKGAEIGAACGQLTAERDINGN